MKADCQKAYEFYINGLEYIQNTCFKWLAKTFVWTNLNRCRNSWIWPIDISNLIELIYTIHMQYSMMPFICNRISYIIKHFLPHMLYLYARVCCILCRILGAYWNSEFNSNTSIVVPYNTVCKCIRICSRTHQPFWYINCKEGGVNSFKLNAMIAVYQVNISWFLEHFIWFNDKSFFC